MAQDRYALAPLRDVREHGETRRRGDLATAIDDAHVSAQALAATRARTEQARATLARALADATLARTGLTRSAQLVLAERYLARRRQELAAARDEELRATLAHEARRDEVEGARALLARARADREVIERHFARWREAQRRRAETRAD